MDDNARLYNENLIETRIRQLKSARRNYYYPFTSADQYLEIPRVDTGKPEHYLATPAFLTGTIDSAKDRPYVVLPDVGIQTPPESCSSPEALQAHAEDLANMVRGYLRRYLALLAVEAVGLVLMCGSNYGCCYGRRYHLIRRARHPREEPGPSVWAYVQAVPCGVCEVRRSHGPTAETELEPDWVIMVVEQAIVDGVAGLERVYACHNDGTTQNSSLPYMHVGWTEAVAAGWIPAGLPVPTEEECETFGRRGVAPKPMPLLLGSAVANFHSRPRPSYHSHVFVPVPELWEITAREMPKLSDDTDLIGIIPVLDAAILKAITTRVDPLLAGNPQVIHDVLSRFHRVTPADMTADEWRWTGTLSRGHWHEAVPRLVRAVQVARVANKCMDLLSFGPRRKRRLDQGPQDDTDSDSDSGMSECDQPRCGQVDAMDVDTPDGGVTAATTKRQPSMDAVDNLAGVSSVVHWEQSDSPFAVSREEACEVYDMWNTM